MSIPLSSLSPTQEIKIGEITLIVGRVTISVFARFERWCKDQIMQDAARFSGMVPSEGRGPILQKAMEIVSTFSIMSEKGKEFMMSSKGVIALLHFAQKGTSHSIEEIEANITPESLLSIQSTLMSLAGATDVDPTHPQSKATTTGDR